MQEKTSKPNWAKMLKDAVTMKGTLSKAYSTFHNYSIGNQLLAMGQFAAMGKDPQPIATYKDWQKVGRQVQRNQKSSIALIMPVTLKKKDQDGEKTGEVFQSFMLRNYWFSIDQTEGEEYKPEPFVKDWDANKALEALDITQVNYADVNGNCQGYATGRTFAINPLAVLPNKTRFHEMAHIVLGHTSEGLCADSERTPRDIREVEAESVAYILCSVFELPGLEESRGYIQNWLNDAEITEKSARRIFSAADKILKAGK